MGNNKFNATLYDINNINLNEISLFIDVTGVKVVSHRYSLYITAPNTGAVVHKNLFEYYENNVLILGDFNITNNAYFLKKGETKNNILALNNYESFKSFLA